MLQKSFRIFAVPLFSDNYSYIVQTGPKEPLLLVDPANPSVIMNCLLTHFPQQPVGHVLYTHRHWDHAGGAPQLYKLLTLNGEKVEVLSGAEDAAHIQTVTRAIESDGELKLGQVLMRAYKVPCHTRGHVVYHLVGADTGVEGAVGAGHEMRTSEGKRIRVFEESQCAFTGDTLFSAAIGRFFEGNASEMFANLQKLHKNLSKTCPVFNGHEYTLDALRWGLGAEPQNPHIKQYIQQLQSRSPDQLCTLPTTLQRQSQINVFLRAVLQPSNSLGIGPVQYLRVLREAKNANSHQLPKFL